MAPIPRPLRPYWRLWPSGHAVDELGMIGSSWNARALTMQLNQIGGMKPKVIAKADVAAGFAHP